eukprot:TRINITY_DN35234_c0_g2_i1.p1 TRINITY_DN35234_c0_g2~~TRINITY_DN35234_c0_g2_i1.p1  ORF type:complete len:921 (+),score=144.03 TRINITY_DN35234_c0_g2_i1:86-2848(+)
MVTCIQRLVDKLTFPSAPSSYSLTSHPELCFATGPRSTYPGVPCMLYAIRQGAPVLLVHAHSNACDIGEMGQSLRSIAETLRIHVMSFEFPGYGLHLGTASMRSINEAVSATLHFVTQELRVDPSQVVWYGRSIGSGPATWITHYIATRMKQRPGGLVLQCGYANFPEVVGHLFGRVAKRLVSPLWPNEALLKECDCPVLLIHGRWDAMIPISQSEKLWNAVSARDLSHYEICNCGHNDFNFRRGTLKPIYDFLLSVISAPSYPARNFTIEVPPSSRATVHHIGPLRSRIPVYSFGRPELEEWLHEVQQNRLRSEQCSSLTESPDLVPAAGTFTSVGQAKPAPASISAKVHSSAAADPADAFVDIAKRNEKNGAAASPPLLRVPPPPPLPDLSDLPPELDVAAALTDPEGLMKTCASRVAAYLDRLQRQLGRVEGLDQKLLEDVVDLVEAEFWESNPLLSLWEEIQLPRGDLVRFRMGPFWVDSTGASGCDLSTTAPQTCDRVGDSGDFAAAELFCVPLWSFTPLRSHFRCLAERSLLQFASLEQTLFATRSQAPREGSAWCCVPCMRAPRRLPWRQPPSTAGASASAEAVSKPAVGSVCRGGRRDAAGTASASARRSARGGSSSRGKRQQTEQPTLETVATSFSVHFANWLFVKANGDENDIFQRFVELHQMPHLAVLAAAGDAARVTLLASEKPAHPTSPQSTSRCSPSFATIHSPSSEGPAGCDSECFDDGSTRQQQDSQRPLPWSTPAEFSAAARAWLRPDVAGPGPTLAAFQRSLWKDMELDTDATKLGYPPRVLPDLEEVVCLQAQKDCEADADWVAACALNCYRRRCGDCDSCEPAGDEHADDPLRPEMRQAALALCQAMSDVSRKEQKGGGTPSAGRGQRPGPKVEPPPQAQVEGADVDERSPPSEAPPMLL